MARHVSSLESLPCIEQEVFKNRPQAQRRKKCEGAENQNHTDQKKCEKRRCDRKCTQRRRYVLLLSEIARDRKHRNDHEEPAEQHGHPNCGVVPRSVSGESTK